jgi:hypothetical protein
MAAVCIVVNPLAEKEPSRRVSGNNRVSQSLACFDVHTSFYIKIVVRNVEARLIIHGAGYPHPGGYDDFRVNLCITIGS